MSARCYRVEVPGSANTENFCVGKFQFLPDGAVSIEGFDGEVAQRAVYGAGAWNVVRSVAQRDCPRCSEGDEDA